MDKDMMDVGPMDAPNITRPTPGESPNAAGTQDGGSPAGKESS